MKLIASLCAFVVYSSLGAASVSGESLSASESLGVEALAIPEAEDIAAASVTSDSITFLLMGEMSDEERERRKHECEKLWEACYDWCSRSNNNKKDQRFCYESKCAPQLAACMKKIPY